MHAYALTVKLRPGPTCQTIDRDHATLARTMRNVPSIHLVFDDEVFALPADPDGLAAKAR